MNLAKYVTSVVLFVISFSTAAVAQDASDCSSLMKFGIYDKYKTLATETQFKQVQEFFSSYQFSSLADAQSKAGTLGVDIPGIVGVSFGGNTAASNFSQWVQNLTHATYQEALASGLQSADIQKISNNLTDLVGKCLTQKGVHAYIIPSSDNQTFFFTADYVPSGADHPSTKGTITMTPASVATSCAPLGVLGQPQDLGPQGISLSCRRLPTDTVAVTLNTADGTLPVHYDAYVVPLPSVTFNASSLAIDSGNATTLAWNVTNASNVTLVNFGPVQLSGSATVNPTQTTTYTLVVTSLDGKQTSTFVTVSVNPPPPILTNASVSFRTTDNDKDGDTNVSIYVICGGNTVAAVSGQWGHWDDNSDHGPIGMSVTDHPRKDQVIGACTARVVESPKGHDEWHFNWGMVLTFSDGTNKSYNWGGGNVDYNRTTVNQPL
jgi:hypothetical protein